MTLLAEARPTMLVAIRRRQERWQTARALLRTLQQIVQANAYLDGGRALDEAQDVELAINELVLRLDTEATRLSVESMQLYLHTVARSADREIEMETICERAHREAGSPTLEPIKQLASMPRRSASEIARAFCDVYPREGRFKGPQYEAAIHAVIIAFKGHVSPAAAAIGRSPTSLYKFLKKAEMRKRRAIEYDAQGHS